MVEGCEEEPEPYWYAVVAQTVGYTQGKAREK